MMADPDQPAFPELHIHHFMTDADGEKKPCVTPRWMGGLTKREYFAALAMQGTMARAANGTRFSAVASDSVLMADALIAELNKAKAEAE